MGESTAEATDPSSVLSVIKWKLCEAVGTGDWRSVTTVPHGVCSVQSYRSDDISPTKPGGGLV